MLHRSMCALTVRNNHGAEFLIAKQTRSRADPSLSWQLRVGIAFGMPIVLLFSAIGRSHLGNPGSNVFPGTWWYPTTRDRYHAIPNTVEFTLRKEIATDAGRISYFFRPN